MPVAVDWTQKIGRCAEYVNLDVHTGSLKDVISIEVRGQIHTPLRASTHLVDFGTITAGESATQHLRIAADNVKGPVRLDRCVARNPAFKLVKVLADGEVAQGPPWIGSLIEFDISCSPTNADSEISDFLSLEFGDRALNTNSVRLHCLVKPKEYCLPSECIVTSGPASPTTWVRIFSPTGVLRADESIDEDSGKVLAIVQPSRSGDSQWWRMGISAKEGVRTSRVRNINIALGNGSSIVCKVVVEAQS
jgi:hypothetical protein